METAAAKRDPLATPMIRQYLDLKSQQPDAVLLFRMGDFYEVFLDDARRVAPILGIQLTSRNKGDPDEIPLCGFPYHQLDSYVAILIEKGLKVAIGEQVEETVHGKKVFRRELARVITPGLYCPGEMATEAEMSKTRLLVALRAIKRAASAPMFALSFLNFSTGDFAVTEICGDGGEREILDELARLEPSEILLEEKSPLESLVHQVAKTTSFRPSRFFDDHDAARKLAAAFSVQSLHSFGFDQHSPGLGAAKAILEYVRETQGADLKHVQRLRPYKTRETLQIDAASRRNLELTRSVRGEDRAHTLLSVLDVCRTRAGHRLLAAWIHQPLVDRAMIEARLDVVERWKDGLTQRAATLQTLLTQLSDLADLERICNRLALGTSSPRDLAQVGRSFENFLKIHEALKEESVSEIGRFKGVLENPFFEAMGKRISTTLTQEMPAQWREGNFIRSGFDASLDEYRSVMHNAKEVMASIENREREKTGISSLKIRYNKVFGYYLEVTKSHLKNVPDYFIRKQTLVNAERFIVPDLKVFEEKLLGAEAEAVAIEMKVFRELCQDLVTDIPLILSASRVLAEMDALLGFACVAEEWNYCRPVLTEDLSIQIRAGRHPVVEQILQKSAKTMNERFVPNDLEMDAGGRQILLITGPNMAGKSTVMRQTALIILMAQMGSFVPAGQARLGIVDRIFTRVGASDSLSQGQSTFMVEMQETANILHNATPKSFVILDEIGRGTSTFDGVSIAWATAEYIHEHLGCRTLFATHYHELAELPEEFPRIVNCHIAVREWNDHIVFLRTLQEGATNRSYGIQVARLAGIPAKVIARSQEILAILEQHHLRPAGKQLKLFSEGIGTGVEQRAKAKAENPAWEELRQEILQLKLDALTPLESMIKISQWQKRLFE